jgi:transcriptional regulator with XRE-family HTH domain
MTDFIDRLLDLLADKDPVPNKVTIGMGKLIRQARKESGMSQRRLANEIYRRRATISDLENGKSEVTISTLALIAAVLNKPISYFLPWFIYENLRSEDLEPLEHEVLIHFRKIRSDDLQKLAIDQVKHIADTDVKISKDQLKKQVDKLLPPEE